MFAGTSQTAGPEVGRFYSYWMDFCTSKPFAWADKWHPGTAQNRKVCRGSLLRLRVP